METLRQWAEGVAVPWLVETWPSIATGGVFVFTLWLLTFHGPEEDED